MAILEWDKTGERLYETGTDHGVLFLQTRTGEYDKGIAWNGLIGVSNTAEGGEETPIYANNDKYLSLRSAEEAKGTITAYTYPKEFRECDGSKQIAPGVYAGQQHRKTFGLAYETIIGNDTEGNEYSRTMHIAYGATAAPSDRDYKTVNNDPEAIEFSWEYTTTKAPTTRTGVKPMGTIEIVEHEVGEANYKKLQDLLWGTASEESKLPTPDEVFTLLASAETDPEG